LSREKIPPRYRVLLYLLIPLVWLTAQLAIMIVKLRKGIKKSLVHLSKKKRKLVNWLTENEP